MYISNLGSAAMPNVAIFVTTVGIAFACARASATDGMADIIEVLRSNEALYSNVEMRLIHTYRLVHFGEGEEGLLRSSTSKMHIVYQQGMLYVKQDLSRVGSDGDTHEIQSVQGYDGDTSRLVRESKLVNIRQGRHRDSSQLQPALVVQQFVRWTNPLSELFSTTTLMDGKVNATFFADGLEEVAGLKCAKVRCETWTSDPEKRNRAIFWLAIDRNYFPVRCEYFARRHSSAVPFDVGVVTEWLELSPGIWFPAKVRREHYDPIALRQGKRTLSTINEYVFESVSLTPKYDKAFFQDIPIPKDARVIEIDSSGKVVRQYGGKAASTVSDVLGGQHRLLLLGVIPVVIGAMVLGRRLFIHKAV